MGAARRENKRKKSYRIKDVLVKEHNGKRYLSCADGSSVEEVDDIGECSEESAVSIGGGRETIHGQIVGILSCTRYAGCVACGAKAIESGAVGQCGKCSLK